MPNKNYSSCFGFVIQDINRKRFRPYYSNILMVIKMVDRTIDHSGPAPIDTGFIYENSGFGRSAKVDSPEV